MEHHSRNDTRTFQICLLAGICLESLVHTALRVQCGVGTQNYVFITHSQLPVNENCNNLLPSLSPVTFHSHFPSASYGLYVLNQHLSTVPRASLSSAPFRPQSSLEALWQSDHRGVPMTLESLCRHPWPPAEIRVFNQTLDLKSKTCLKRKPLFTQILFLCFFSSLMLSYFYPSYRYCHLFPHSGCTHSGCRFYISSLFTIFSCLEPLIERSVTCQTGVCKGKQW